MRQYGKGTWHDQQDDCNRFQTQFTFRGKIDIVFMAQS